MMLRQAGHRKFRATNALKKRRATLLGIGPSPQYVIGWWDGMDKLTELDKDHEEWINLELFTG